MVVFLLKTLFPFLLSSWGPLSYCLTLTLSETVKVI